MTQSSRPPRRPLLILIVAPQERNQRAQPLSRIPFLRASFFAVWFVLSAPSAVLAAPDCTHWMDNDDVDGEVVIVFWKTATPDDVARCLKAGADLEARGDKSGFTALHWAALFGNADTVADLLKSGAYLEARTKKCVTPLHVAAWSGKADTVTALLKAGASPKARSKDGKRPIDLADQEGKLTGPAYWQLHDASFD